MSPADGSGVRTPATYEELQRFAADCAGELERIRCRVAMIQAALVVENTSVCVDAARLLQLDVDDELNEYVERARKLSGCYEEPEEIDAE